MFYCVSISCKDKQSWGLLKVDSKLNSLAKLQGQNLAILSTIRIWLQMFLARMVRFHHLLTAVFHHLQYQKDGYR